MKTFSTSLLREKFVLHDPKAGIGKKKSDIPPPVIALSNRMVVDLENDKGVVDEQFVVRAQNMHCCIRMCAKILQIYKQGGPIMIRPLSYDWDTAWSMVVNDYEHAYNPDRWVAVYYKGRPVFEKGERHPLLDVIEKCNIGNTGSYDDSIILAEDAFKQTGKMVKIEYDGNVALVVNLEREEGRCGIILRGANKTTTFNYAAEAKKGTYLNFAQCLSAAAAFLEGIQLSFLVGMNGEKTRLGIIELRSAEDKQTQDAQRRLARLSAEITNLESSYRVRYRPERPEFPRMVLEAEKFAQSVLEAPD